MRRKRLSEFFKGDVCAMGCTLEHSPRRLRAVRGQGVFGDSRADWQDIPTIPTVLDQYSR